MPVSAIILADIHFREKCPQCREPEEFFLAQKNKLGRITEVWNAHSNPPILVAGDVFDEWRGSPALLRMVLEHMPEFIAVPGQHDLPQHRLDGLDRSSLGVLEAAGVATVLGPGQVWRTSNRSAEFSVTGFPWGSAPGAAPVGRPAERKIALAHRFTYRGRAPWPGCEDPTTSALLRKFPGYDLVVCGDNHKPSKTVTRSGRTLLVPGSMMRTTAAQQQYRPAMWLYTASDNSVVPEYFDVDPGAVSKEHLVAARTKEDRTSMFIRSLDGEQEAALSFESNMDRALRGTNVDPRVIEIVRSCMEG